MSEKSIDVEKVKELRDKGIVSEAGYIRAKIITRFEELKGTDTKADLYCRIGNEFCLSEGRVKNIVTGYYRRK